MDDIYNDERSMDLWNQYGGDDSALDEMSEQRFLEQLMLEEHQRMQNEYSVTRECVIPTLSQGVESVWLLLVMCLALRCLALLKLNHKLLHLASALAGCSVLWHFYGNSSGYVILLCVTGYICLANQYTGNGGYVSVICVAFLLGWTCLTFLTMFLLCDIAFMFGFSEKFIVEEMVWNKIRGSVMIVSMKLIFIGFEKNYKSMADLDSLSYYGYILNPASIIFGPFVTYKDYLQLFQSHSVSISWILNVIKTIMLSAICLLWSTCGNSYLLPQLGTGKWLDAYKDANAFRFSTYFVSYISESTCLAMGIGTMCRLSQQDDTAESKKEDVDKKTNVKVATSNKQDLKPNKAVNEEKRDEKVKACEVVYWSRPVSNPLAVEFPRSLVEVVTNWNLPMHFWLKNYVFRTSKSLGIFPAILLTYFASALLHGLNFQLSVILFSIGVFAYIENGIRKTLATTFDACIEARSCKSTCTHKYKNSNFWVISANLAFGFIAVWNLAYLGCLFDNNPEIQDTGYSMFHALRKWAALGYSCHIFMLCVLIFNKMI